MADENIPANWYPDATGTIRWWDGQQWTEHVRDSAPTSSSTSATSVMPAASPATPTSTYTSTSASDSPLAYIPGRSVTQSRVTDDDDEEPNHSRRLWLTSTFVGLLAFFLGMGIGGRGEPVTPVASQPTYYAPEPTSDPVLDQQQSDLDAREKELDAREDELDEREDNLASATPTPTPSPTPTDLLGLDDTADDGTWRVGTDIAAGTYSTTGPSDDLLQCDYTISNDEAGDDVVSDDSSYESMTISLADGQYFTTDNCDTWQRD